MDNDVMTAADAARELGIALTTLRTAVQQERLNAVIVAGRIFIRPSDLEAYRLRTRGPDGEKPRGRPRKGMPGSPDEGWQ